MVTELGENWDDVLSKERISIVKCYADWCGPCKFYAPHFQRFSENLSVYNDTEIKYYQSNNDNLKGLKARYKVDALPSTLILIHGILVYKIKGVTRQTVLENLIEKALEIPYEKRIK